MYSMNRTKQNLYYYVSKFQSKGKIKFCQTMVAFLEIFNFNCLETGTTARKYPERPHHLDELCQLLSGRRPTHGVRYVSPLETSVRKYHIQRDLTTLMNSAHDFSQADLEYVTFLRS